MGIGTRQPTAADEPADFPHLHHVKAIGRHEDLLGAVRAAIAPYAPDLPDTAFSVRDSREGQYTSVTCSVTVEDAGQLRAIYAAVGEIRGIILCL